MRVSLETKLLDRSHYLVFHGLFLLRIMSRHPQQMPMPGYNPGSNEGYSQQAPRMPEPQDYTDQGSEYNGQQSLPIDEMSRLGLNEQTHHRPHHLGQQSHAHDFQTETQRQTQDQQQELQHHPSNVVVGPLLRYDRIDMAAKVWRGSCLIVSDDVKPPVLSLHVGSEKGASRTLHSHATLLDVYRCEFHFWRFPLEIPMADHGQTIVYTATCFVARMNFAFHLPSYSENMRFMFYSCNGFTDVGPDLAKKLGAPNHPLWQDVLEKHKLIPFHVLLGGGDQLYQDDMIEEDYMKPWKNETNIPKRLSMSGEPFIEPMERFYFNNYVKCFG